MDRFLGLPFRPFWPRRCNHRLFSVLVLLDFQMAFFPFVFRLFRSTSVTVPVTPFCDTFFGGGAALVCQQVLLVFELRVRRPLLRRPARRYRFRPFASRPYIRRGISQLLLGLRVVDLGQQFAVLHLHGRSRTSISSQRPPLAPAPAPRRQWQRRHQQCRRLRLCRNGRHRSRPRGRI